MAYYLFTEAIRAGRPIKVFNHGQMQRDFTYIDDILPAIAAAGSAARPGENLLYNLGNNRPVMLANFIAQLESLLGREAIKIMTPMEPGDVTATYADIGPARRDLNFNPKTSIAEGLSHFVTWHREYTRQTR
jgi:UDP-glucuronate 4-epimerase